ncbi:MAG: DUF2851 family protein [Cyclobacteriaceae bacterium]|nr:DUF2851 family protein [Cyclobacteriaceae bacterium]
MTIKKFYPKNEQFVHFLWLTQSFNKCDLRTSRGEVINIFYQGYENHNAGPDFSQANITIGEINWNGSVEIHTKASDWHQHKHHFDRAYDNVILHVVWINDKTVKRMDQSEIPTLELKNRVPLKIIINYTSLLSNKNQISCMSSFKDVDPIILLNLLDRMTILRTQGKVTQIHEHLSNTKNDWEEVTFRLLCRNLGFNINAFTFSLLATSIPFQLLRKYKKNIIQLEALLFGMAGLLHRDSTEPYYHLLLQEFTFLSHKHHLTPTISYHQWKFHRLRPANFPTIRIAQLASILHDTDNLFSVILKGKDYNSLIACLSVEVSDFWMSHFRFEKTSGYNKKAIGKSSIENICINTVVPVMYAYGKYIDDNSYCENALDLLQNIPAEQNKVTRKWNELGIPCKSAFDSQALLHLYNNFCKRKQCLLCDLGKNILKK